MFFFFTLFILINQNCTMYFVILCFRLLFCVCTWELDNDNDGSAFDMFEEKIYTHQVARNYTHVKSLENIHTASRWKVYTHQVAGIYTHGKSLESIHTSSRLKVYTRQVAGKYTHVKSLESIHTASRLKVYARQVA